MQISDRKRDVLLWLLAALIIGGQSQRLLGDEQETPVPLQEIDPRHLPEQDVTGKNYRFIIWQTPSSETWHIRMTTNGWTRTFTGAVRMQHATFKTLRPIGLESQKEDPWELNPERTQLIFKTKTNKAHDGFDFTTKPTDGQPVVVEFDLKIGNKRQRKHIFIGEDQKHPSAIPFGLSIPDSTAQQ